jgi:indolepyruvate ferredoxin oxidoreductase beta subunit
MNRNKKVTNLIITGVGGQGNVLAARLLGSAALAEGYEVTVGDVYGLTQRGGSVASHIRMSRGKALPPYVPQGALDVVVGFEPMEALRVLAEFGCEESLALVNDAPVMPIGVQAGRFKYPHLEDLREALRLLSKNVKWVGATQIARSLGDIQALNMVMMGALVGSGFIRLGMEAFKKAIRSTVSKRLVDLDLSAFEAGFQVSKS